MSEKSDWERLPGILVKKAGRLHHTPPDLRSPGLPPLRRDMIDNVRYFSEGGQAGFESNERCSEKSKSRF